jgi:hypothetical protein
LAKRLALAIAKFDDTPFRRRQLPEPDGNERDGRIFLLQWKLHHGSAVPPCVVADLTGERELDVPVLAGPLDPKTAVGAAAEPMLRADTVENRAVNPTAREHRKRDVPAVESVSCFDKAFRPVGNEVIEIDAFRKRPRVSPPGYRSHEVKVSSDAFISRYTVNSERSRGFRSDGRVGRRDTLHGIDVLGWQRPL